MTTPSPKRPRLDTSTPVGTICVLGATGVGKGSTLNSCFGTDKFSTSHRFASDTVKPISLVLPWRGTGAPMRGVDLCGFSDSEGRDTGFIEAMVAFLREEVRQVTCFLLLLNAQEPRLGVHLKDMLVALKSVFGVAFTRNVVVGFTRWDDSRRGATMRRGLGRDALRESVNGLLRELLGHEHDCECVFLDNTVSMCSEAELRELYTCTACHRCSDELALIRRSFDEALETIRRAAVDSAPFWCGDIEGTLAERDVGRDLIERERAAVEEGEAALAKLQQSWAALGVESPEALEAQTRGAARAAREALVLFLAAKTKPDLEHVMASTLEAFDTRLAETVRSVVSGNRQAAASFNRALRMRLVAEYKVFIGERTRPPPSAEGGGGGRSGGGGEGGGEGRETTAARRRFDAIRAQFGVSIGEFVASCKGGALAWPPLSVLQDQLRMEQVDARERLLRDEVLNGRELPPLSEALKDAGAVVGLLGAQSAPEWLLALSGSGGGTVRRAAVG